MPYTVPYNPCPILFDTAYVLVFFTLAAAIGYRFQKAVGAANGSLSDARKGLVSVGIGLGFLQFLPFFLGLAHQLTPRNLWIGLAALLIMFSRDMLSVIVGIVRRTRQYRGGARFPWGDALLLAIPLGICLLWALCPPTQADALYYHLTGPKRWLQFEQIRYLPSLTMTQFTMGFEMLFTIAMGTWSDTAANLMHYSAGLLSLCAIYVLARRHAGAPAAILAAGTFLLLPKMPVIKIMCAGYVDLGTTFLSLCAVICWEAWYRDRSPKLLVCAALCAGFAGTFKMTAMLLGILLALMTIWTLARSGTDWKRAAATGAQCIAIAMAPLVPWLLKTWVQTGNPVYPFLSRVFPSRDWSQQTGERFHDFIANCWLPSANLSAGARHVLLGLTVMVVALIFAAYIRWCRRADVRALAVITALWTVQAILATGPYLRYLLPQIALICVLAAVALQNLARSPWFRWGWIAALLALTLRGAREDLNIVASLKTAMGRTSRADFLHQAHMDIPMDIWDYINTNAAPGDNVLMYGYCFSYYSDPYCLISSSFLQHRIRMESWELFSSDIRRDNIRFFVIPEGSGLTPPRDWELAQRMIADRGTLVKSSKGIQVYRLAEGTRAALHHRQPLPQHLNGAVRFLPRPVILTGRL